VAPAGVEFFARSLDQPSSRRFHVEPEIRPGCSASLLINIVAKPP
jgi:hypothetical protein